ncbi:MAG: DUF2007 domain-containing protein [Alistipes sp.]|nr:DUF2007 domain-containing protein [Alistipes sp.]MDO5497630.1 DUF2007 domain-containing protein [Alistipes sp.]
MREENLIVLREYDSINDAEWDRSILEGAGIYATIRNELMSNIYPVGFAPAQLIVESSDLTRAEEILKAYSAE